MMLPPSYFTVGIYFEIVELISLFFPQNFFLIEKCLLSSHSTQLPRHVYNMSDNTVHADSNQYLLLQLLKCCSGSFGSIIGKCLSFLFVIFETNMEEVMGRWTWKLCIRISEVKIKMGLHMIKIDIMRIRKVCSLV